MSERAVCGTMPEAHSRIGRYVWRVFSRVGSFVTLPCDQQFRLAAGTEAEIKVVSGPIFDNASELREMAAIFKSIPCVGWAEAIGYVPDGVRPLALALTPGGRDIVHMHRRPAGERYDFSFGLADSEEHTAERAIEVLQKVGSICLLEDISSTGSSAYAVAALMRGVRPDLQIHSLSMLQRGPIDPIYTQSPDGVTYHTLLRRDVPLTRRAFSQEFPEIIPRLLQPGEY